MSWFTRIVLFTGAVIVGREVYLAFGPRRWRRRDLFARAQARATQTGKSVLVIGDPDAGLVTKYFGRDYGCGDMCVDMHGCDGCPVHVIGELEDILPGLPDNSAVVYVSCVLEYVNDIPAIWHELIRISGGDLYIVHVEPLSLTAFFYPGAKNRIFEAPPEDRSLRWKPVWGGREQRLQLGPGGSTSAPSVIDVTGEVVG